MVMKVDVLCKVRKVLKRETLEIIDEFTCFSLNWMNCASSMMSSEFWTQSDDLLLVLSQRMNKTKKGHSVMVTTMYSNSKSHRANKPQISRKQEGF